MHQLLQRKAAAILPVLDLQAGAEVYIAEAWSTHRLISWTMLAASMPNKVTKEGPGVLRLLESQCKAPEASDAKFFEDVNRFHKDNKFFKTVQRVKAE